MVNFTLLLQSNVSSLTLDTGFAQQYIYFFLFSFSFLFLSFSFYTYNDFIGRTTERASVAREIVHRTETLCVSLFLAGVLLVTCCVFGFFKGEDRAQLMVRILSGSETRLNRGHVQP